MKEPKTNQEDIVKEVLPVKEDVIKEVLDVESPAQVEVDATQAIQAQPEKAKKKTGVIIATICISLIIVLALIGVAAITTFSKMTKKPEEKTKKAEVKKPVQASPYRLSGNGLEDFDLYFLQLENKEDNVVYSPLSIKYALAMLNEGTTGTTHEQITSVIGDYKSKKYNNNSHMSFANAMFIRETFKNSVKDDYTKNLQDKYGAEIILDKFESAANANSWVSNRTFNLINNLLDDNRVKNADFILINALAIDMNWVNRIQSATAPLPEGMGQKKYTVSYIHEDYEDYVAEIMYDHYPSMTFNNDDKTKSVKVGASFNRYDIVKDKGEDNIRKTVTDDMTKYLKEHPDQVKECPTVDEYVNQFIIDIDKNYKQEAVSTDFSIYVDDDVKLFAKDLQTYDGTTLQYIGVMPKNKPLASYIETLKASDLNQLISKLKEVKYDNFKEGVITQVKGNIPLFNYDYELNLMSDLKKLGIEDVFTKDADLSKMVNADDEFISDVTHKAKIEFSNDGIKAAAATSASGAGASGPCNYNYIFEVPVEKIDVTFDKPYLYIIRDKETGEVWFTGTVYKAEKNN